jgi:hypothetical protein
MCEHTSIAPFPPGSRNLSQFGTGSIFAEAFRLKDVGNETISFSLSGFGCIRSRIG